MYLYISAIILAFSLGGLFADRNNTAVFMMGLYPWWIYVSNAFAFIALIWVSMYLKRHYFNKK